ncbi:hypothetical protein MC885_015914, partial [Smutsia gigantea]
MGCPREPPAAVLPCLPAFGPGFREVWYELGESWLAVNKDLEQRSAQVHSCGDNGHSLPAPQNPKIHLHNAEQVLSWEPVSLSNDTRLVVYQVQFKYSISSRWYDVSVDDIGVDCRNITTTTCNFTPTSLSEGFPPHFNVSLRVRAKLEDLVSAWLTVPWFQYYRNGKRTSYYQNGIKFPLW